MTLAQQQIHEACTNLSELADKAGYYITLNKKKRVPRSTYSPIKHLSF